MVRIHDVDFPLLVTAPDWCVVDQEPTYGFLIKEIKSSKAQVESAAGSGVSVADVHPQSLAASADLLG